MLYNYTPLLRQKILYSCTIWDTCNAGDGDLIPGSGRSPGVGNGNPLQFSCLGNSMDRGAWRATVHGVAESDTIEWAQARIHIMEVGFPHFRSENVKSLSRVQLFVIPGASHWRILEWVAIPFSRESSWPRDRTHVSCIEGIFLTIWTNRNPNPNCLANSSKARLLIPSVIVS